MTARSEPSRSAAAGIGGAIVNAASMAGVEGAANMPAYSASKAAVRVWGEGVRWPVLKVIDRGVERRDVLLALAREHRVDVRRVSVRNQRARWGACSSAGVITLNWRLLQTPPMVSDYVIFHELMHRRQPNHSRRFWKEVASVCPWWREAERWIRQNGRTIL